MELLKNKWVLYGGGAVLAIGAFFLFSGRSSAPVENESNAPVDNFSPLMASVYGAAPMAIGFNTSSNQESALPSFDATRELLTLENKKADNEFSLQMALAEQAQALGLYRQTSDEKIALDTNKTTLDVVRTSTIGNIASDFIKNAKLKKTSNASVNYDGTLVSFARS